MAAGGRDHPIGKVRIRLNALESNRVYVNSYPLLLLTRQGVKKMGELELALRFSCAHTSSVVLKYLKPPLPDLHYERPIPQKDKEGLRLAAMQLVAGQLAKADLPLRLEVVHFMLDTDETLFSMRRIKANLFRIKAVLAGPMALLKWLVSVREWQHPPTTLAAHLLFALVIYYPELLLPVVLLSTFLRGAQLYRLRPVTPPFMDEKLSQGEEMEDPDELEEEMDQTAALKSKEGGMNPLKYYKVLEWGADV